MATKDNISVIVQARMTSKRLPGKVLKKICGKHVITHIIERLRACHTVSNIILTIPDTKPNDSLAEYAKKINCPFFRGSENDVLTRYYETAKFFNVNTVVRITSDCPLVDPKILYEAIEFYKKSDFDYVAVGIEGNFPRGLDTEIFSFNILERVNVQAQLSYEREHVTPYIYNHPELFKIHFLEAKGKLRRPDLRLTIDTEDDLQLIRKIFKKLYKNGAIFGLEEVVELLDKHPEFLKINAHVHQKGIFE